MKRILRRILLLSVTLFLLALAGEGVLRAASPRGGMDLFERTGNPDLPVVLAPGREGWVAGAPVRINAQGLREDRDTPPAKPAGLFRIACLGDSITFGQGVEAGRAFPQLLEKALDRDGSRVQVLNFGIPGQNTVNEAEYLRRKVLSWKPDLVLLTVVLNDIEEAPYQDLSERPWHVRVLSRSLLLQWLAPKAGALMRATGLGGGKTTEGEYLRQYDPQGRPWGRMSGALLRLDADCRIAGARLAVLLYTDLGPSLNERYPFLGVHRQLADFCKSHEIPVQDSFEGFRGKQSRNLIVHFMDLHPNAEGHRILAEEALKLIEPLRQKGVAIRWGSGILDKVNSGEART